MHPFSTPWKYQKAVRFSDIFKGQRKGALGMNVLKSTVMKKNVFTKPTVYKTPQNFTISCYDFENLTYFKHQI